MNEIKETQYKVDAIRNNITRIQQSIIDIDSEIARLSRADRITRIAKQQLGMVNSKPGIDVVIIE
jgi:cell division protein FtsL